MRFLLDAQLPPALALRISEAGHLGFHVSASLSGDAEDLAVAQEANRLGAVLVSKDADFVQLSARGLLHQPFVWVRSGNMTTARLWYLLGPLLPAIVLAVEAGERVIEVR